MNDLENHTTGTEATTPEPELNLRTWRKEMVWALKAKGYSHREIIDKLKAGHPDVKISLGTITNDLKEKQAEISEQFKTYIEQELPHLHRLAVTGLDQVLKEAWDIFENEHDNRSRLQALAVIQSAIMSKQQVLGDPAQIQRAIKIVAQLKKQLGNSDESSNSGNSTEHQHEELQQKEGRDLVA